jgi:hypothetical protein
VEHNGRTDRVVAIGLVGRIDPAAEVVVRNGPIGRAMAVGRTDPEEEAAAPSGRTDRAIGPGESGTGRPL